MESKTCPRCGHSGPVASDFGYRKRNAGLRPQSFCFECRSNKKRKMPQGPEPYGRSLSQAELPPPVMLGVDKAKKKDRTVVARTGDVTDYVEIRRCTQCLGIYVMARFRWLAKQGRYHSWCRYCEKKGRKK